MIDRITQREVREIDEIVVSPTHIMLIQARPPMTADEIAEQYERDNLNRRARILRFAKDVFWSMLFTAAAIFGLGEIYFMVRP